MVLRCLNWIGDNFRYASVWRKWRAYKKEYEKGKR